MGLFSKPDYVGKGDAFYHKGELAKAAEMYVKAKRHEQAADVYVKLGDLDKAVEVLRAAQLQLKAGELLESQGEHKKAIALFDEAGAPRKAAEASLNARQYVRAGRYFEQAEMYRRAAESFSQAGEHEHALGAWEREIENLRKQSGEKPDHFGLKHEIRELELLCAEILENLGRFSEAARILMRYAMAARAAPMFEKARCFTEAAEAYLDAARPEDALHAIEQARNADDELRAEIYLRCSRHTDAGKLFEQAGRYEEAAVAFETADDWAQAAELWEQAEMAERAAEDFARVGRYQDAARCYARADLHEDAAEAFAKAGNNQGAAAAYEEAGKPLTAARFYIEAGLAEEAVKTLQGIDSSGPGYGEASALLIPLLLEQGLVEGAQYRLEALRENGALDKLPKVERLYLTGRIEEAQGRYQEAEVSYQRVVAEQHDFRDANARLDDVRGKFSPPQEQVADPLRDTAPVAVEPLTSASTSQPPASVAAPPIYSTGEFPTAVAAGSAASAPPPDLTNLPFELQQPCDRWWEGADFFHAMDHRTDKDVVLVSFPQAVVGGEIGRFRRKMGKIVKFEHPRVLKLHDVVLAADNVLLLYEPFTGQPLSRLLTYLGHQPPTARLNVLVQLCEALITALKLNITHQWLSPQTILLDGKARVKLTGFGMREIMAARNPTSQAYLSPEVRDGKEAGPASDVFSLGLLGAELLQAFLPADLSAQTTLDPNAVGWPEDVEETIPRTLRHLLIRCLRASPLDRPSTEELKSALSSIGLVEGQILADRYEITGELGRGGMSRVYRAHDRQFDDEVAIKTVITPVGGSTEDQDRLLREVQICRKITHPNVVRVHDFGRFPGGLFVIMEILDGPGLDLIIQREAPLPLEQVKKLLLEIAAALGEAHRLKVVHRDLKPGNVMIVEGRVKVMDFGIARMTDDSTKQLTRAGEVVGSPLYMSPEQIQGLPVGSTCDLYALGVIAYTLLAGHEPFQAETTTAVAYKHLHEPPPDIREFRSELSAEWVEVLERLLAKKPEDRYQTAEELTAALAPLPV